MKAQARWQLSTRAQWAELDDDERDEKLAWELYCQQEADAERQTRQRLLQSWRETLESKDALTPEAATAILIAGMGG